MTSGINERPYLSIGEVLGLLLEEFPDVTISKIRFLESQGLIEPERTASGYRKFFDADVERLKVILREQRENFLPLRVIRDRLETGAIDESGTGATPAAATTTATPATATAASTAMSGASAAGSPRGLRNVRLADLDRPSARDDTDEFDIETPGRVTVEADEVRTSRHPAAQLRPVSAPLVTSSAVTDLAPPVARPQPTTTAVVPAPPLVPASDDSTSVTAEVPLARPADPTSPVPREPVADAVPLAAPPGPPGPPGPLGPSAPASTNSLYVRSEVCTAGGVTSAQLAELESYGLVAGRGTGNSATYTEGDVAIVRAAAGFLERGIDARHLRGWRQSAEREASLFEQRILPLLRQRNPQARQDAIQLLHDLADLGAQLREAIVLGALRHHLEP